MGKTIRRKTVKNNGYYDVTSRKPRGNTCQTEVSNNIFHSDKPKRWKGISSEVKNVQAKISRSDKRLIAHKALRLESSYEDAECYFDPEDVDWANSDSVYKKKSNECYAYC